MYCQQILRKTWHGNVPWQAAPFTFKIIHFLLQLTFAPLFALMQAIAEWIREIYKLKVKDATAMNIFYLLFSMKVCFYTLGTRP